jgi:cyanate lyase
MNFFDEFRKKSNHEKLDLTNRVINMSMTPLTNEDYLKRVQFEDELKVINAAIKAKGYTFENLAKDLGTNKVWLTSALLGQQWVPEEYCEKLATLLDIKKEETIFLSNHPYKGNTDPILYRLHEVLDTYGPALKELIHEKGGNGIMSAIDFTIDMDIIPDENGDRVVITWNGKLLKYSNQGNYPW